MDIYKCPKIEKARGLPEKHTRKPTCDDNALISIFS